MVVVDTVDKVADKIVGMIVVGKDLNLVEKIAVDKTDSFHWMLAVAAEMDSENFDLDYTPDFDYYNLDPGYCILDFD